MKIISFNANGIRAAGRKGFFEWFKNQRADVLCVQELKAQDDQLQDELYLPKGYYRHTMCAQKKGYSGVAIYSKEKPKKVYDDFGWDLANHEGRYLRADFDNVSVISLYLPSGTAGDHRQEVKYQFMTELENMLYSFKKRHREFIICGDWNIVHKEIDIKNWKGNQKNSGCLPEERAWLDKLFGPMGFVDGFREVNQKPEQYTWWSQRGQARANNVGWRIDYQVLTPGLKGKVKSASVYTDKLFSDHAPLVLSYII